MLTYLKRRFSSSDLQGEFGDGPLQQTQQQQPSGGSYYQHGQTKPMGPPGTRPPPDQYGGLQQQQQPQPGMSIGSGMDRINNTQIPGRVGNVPPTRGRGAYPSAPSSPTRSSGNILNMGLVGSITGQLSKTRNLFSTETLSTLAGEAKASMQFRDKSKILLVIDDSSNDWSKYFRKKTLLNEWDIRVEQAHLNQLSMTAYCDQGCVITVQESGISRVNSKNFKPDFVLLRQSPTSSPANYERILTGLLFSGVACLDSAEVMHNFLNAAWMFSHLLSLRKRLGATNFPLQIRTYHSTGRELILAPVFPITVRMGHEGSIESKIRVDNQAVYQDVVNLVSTSNSYAMQEPCIDATCEIHVQKIGKAYKAFMRKSIAGAWKSMPGSTVLEKVPMTSRFSLWINEVAQLFGGIDVCCVKALQSKTGDFYIVDVTGSDMELLGESQEEDRARIAELIVQRMENALKTPPSPSIVSLGTSSSVASGSWVVGAGPQPSQGPEGIMSVPPPDRSPAITNTPFSASTITEPREPVAGYRVLPEGLSRPPPLASREPPPQPTPSNANAASASSIFGSIRRLSSGGLGPRTVIPTPAEPQRGGGGFGISATTTAAAVASNTPTAFSPTSDGSAPGFDSRFNSSPASQPVLQRNDVFGAVNSKPQQLFNAEPSMDMGKAAPEDPFETTSRQSSFSRSTTSPPSRPMAAEPPGIKPQVPTRQTSLMTTPTSEDFDDTMKNLRKTFAGIFGDI